MEPTHTLPDPTLDPAQRCFGANRPLYQAYHDWEWGRPVRDDAALFERLSLEILAAGLSWYIVLSKRDALRAAWDGFDPAVVAAYGPDDSERVLATPGLIRNRPKVEAIIDNARALRAFQEAGGSLGDLVWSHAPAQHKTPRTFADLPSASPESKALAKALRDLGFRWIGPVIAYATMQAVGVVNDHLDGCPRAANPAPSAPPGLLPDTAPPAA
ncbi:MAG: DNA-3-methyladenine glycosylase I [Propionibacteriaceae bacterium]|jgi:DNA-3-methyladenine glycosylase I|nr:DNA-3-methyladenine glycosylase I [Propionibacteriaceae bacterium]